MGENKEFKAHKKFGEFKTFGEYILEGRDKKGLSRLSLVDKIAYKGYDVSEKNVKFWEKDASYPDITMIYVLAEILEIHPNDLLLAKQYMYEVGLNSIDMLAMRVICNFIDVSIWKIHCFFSVFKWFLLLGILGYVWKISVPWIMIVLFILSIIAGILEFDGI
jgi:transcriptional regulator with XRE-family HTH domain